MSFYWYRRRVFYEALVRKEKASLEGVNVIWLCSPRKTEVWLKSVVESLNNNADGKKRR